MYGATDNLGGIETYLKNYYDNIDRNMVKIDFLNMYEKICFQEHYEKNGINIIKIDSYRRNPIKYIFKLKEILKQGKYDILHCIMNSAVFLQPLISGKLAKIPVIISHSHNSFSDKGIAKELLHNIMKRFIPIFANTFFACSDYAGKWFYNKKIINSEEFFIIKNGIDIDKFKFDLEIRKKKRKELNLKKKDIIIGHVGRFNKQKNHKYLIEVFSKAVLKNKNLKLVLVGTGPLEIEIRELIRKKGIEENSILLGKREDVSELYQAFDAFVLTSLYEGLPLVGVEAQISGCNCIFSEKITKEVKINEKTKFIPINDEKEWINIFLNLDNNIIDRNNIKKDIYNIEKNANEMVEIYNKQLKKEKR